MQTWLLCVLIIGAVILTGIFMLLFAHDSFPHWFFTNTAINMNKIRESLVKANKNKTYRVGVYVEGNLNEVFLRMLKNSLERYMLPIIFVPLHRLAARNLLVENEWLNQIAYPDGKMVDLVVVMKLQESRIKLSKEQDLCKNIEAVFYHPSGAYANRKSSAKPDTPLMWLGYEMAIEITKALQMAVTHPKPAPNFTGNPNIWPYDDGDKKFTFPQHTPL